VAAAWYGTIVLTMLFFWEWFWTLNPDSETGDAVTSHLIYFPIVDSLFVVVALSTGSYLWRDGGSGSATAAPSSPRTPSLPRTPEIRGKEEIQRVQRSIRQRLTRLRRRAYTEH
jgi:hypothetical protein